MSNELLIIISVGIYFGGFLMFYYLFGKKGLLIWNCVALIMANMEVIILIEAFGLKMTLGNVCFASSFLVTDLLCEKYTRKDANMTVLAGFLVTIVFVLITQFWLLYTPANTDTLMPHFVAIFSNTPRVILAGLVVYLVVQLLDVKLYYYWWGVTNKFSNDKRRFLWVRNNLSTIISQFFNAFLFNIIAFYGVFSDSDLLNVMVSTFIIYLIMALLDTPFIYISRMIKPKNLLD